jgi:isoleucyl-tRNA synthetase
MLGQEPRMLEIDRWALAKLNEVVGKVFKAYTDYEFHLVYHLLSEFCTVTLSARYFDIIKDRLYTFAPRNHARRSAQTALYLIADALARMLAPILVFTADEIWESLPARYDNPLPASVHLAALPVASKDSQADFLNKWETLFRIREDVLSKLEEARIAKVIGSSLEARVIIRPGAINEDVLKQYWDDLRYIFIVSQVRLAEPGELAGAPVMDHFGVERAEGKKCERCWNYSTLVGASETYPTVCERCVAALDELEKEAA